MYVARLEWKDITLLVKRQRKIVMLLNVFGSLQRHFWVTYVIHGQWFRPNFRPSRLYENANLVVSSQIIIKGKGITPGWLVSRFCFKFPIPNHIFWVIFLFDYFFLPVFLDTRLPRGNVQEQDSGARFSKVPLTFRARNQVFKSKYKE